MGTDTEIRRVPVQPRAAVGSVPTTMSDPLPRVVIVGGGFGGLAAAKALRKAPVHTVLIDRTNHHLFQPLLYRSRRPC